jgi:hypothetical protein
MSHQSAEPWNRSSRLITDPDFMPLVARRSSRGTLRDGAKLKRMCADVALENAAIKDVLARKR